LSTLLVDEFDAEASMPALFWRYKKIVCCLLLIVEVLLHLLVDFFALESFLYSPLQMGTKWYPAWMCCSILDTAAPTVAVILSMSCCSSSSLPYYFSNFVS
jgi:hypothetical protein